MAATKSKPKKQTAPATVTPATAAAPLNGGVATAPALARVTKPVPWQGPQTEEEVMLSLPHKRFRDLSFELGVPTVTLWRWIAGDRDRYALYKAGREVAAHEAVEEAGAVTELVVDGELDPRRAEVRLKHLHWVAGKSREYADKQAIEHTGTVQHVVKNLDDGELLARINALTVAVKGRAIDADYADITHDTPEDQQ